MMIITDHLGSGPVSIIGILIIVIITELLYYY